MRVTGGKCTQPAIRIWHTTPLTAPRHRLIHTNPRAAIARALIPNPPLLVADEPVSMVDASLRMSIVNLLKSMRDDLRVSVIYITHDLATAYYISNRLIIMQRGRIVEMGDARTVLDNPEHPY